jgi:hypothetical protein
VCRRPLAPALLAAVALALVAAGCGVGAGGTPGGAKLVVTQDFGRAAVLDLADPKVSGSDTVMRFLQRNAEVKTRYGGGFVQSIDGHRGGRSGGRPVDWLYYVNGVEAEVGAASRRLRNDDVVWWDRHDWSAAQRVPAVVGAYPEPFRHGPDGKRLPVRVECIDPQADACQAVQDRMTKAGVLAAQGGLQTSLTKQTLRILVGPYGQLRADDAARLLEGGPRRSGVYARPARDGRTIAVLDDRGHTTRTLGAGAGLVAATRFQDGKPVWFVTGTDARGVAAAAAALDEGNLKNRFALAIAADRGIPLPEGAPR